MSCVKSTLYSKTLLFGFGYYAIMIAAYQSIVQHRNVKVLWIYKYDIHL